MSDLLIDRQNSRVANVKDMATRVAKLGQGLSIREFLDALALAAGSIIRAVYRGPGVTVATESFITAFRKAVNKE
jgi:hypothetical protein